MAKILWAERENPHLWYVLILGRVNHFPSQWEVFNVTKLHNWFLVSLKDGAILGASFLFLLLAGWPFGSNNNRSALGSGNQCLVLGMTSIPENMTNYLLNSLCQHWSGQW